MLPIIETERLILRLIDDEDIHDFYEFAKLPDVAHLAGWRPHVNEKETKIVIRMSRDKIRFGQLGNFAIILKETGKMIGTIELHSYTKDYKAELGFCLNPKYWNQGYITEAAKAVVVWGFDEVHLKRIEAHTFLDNLSSQKVLEKLNFTFEGIKKKGYQAHDGKIYDVKAYGITDYDFYNLVRKNGIK